jgi:hypothetical protein
VKKRLNCRARSSHSVRCYQVGDDGWSKGVGAAAAMGAGLGADWVDGTTCSFEEDEIRDS